MDSGRSLYRAPLVFHLQHAYGFDDPLKWHNGAMNSAPYVASKLVLLEASERVFSIKYALRSIHNNAPMDFR